MQNVCDLNIDTQKKCMLDTPLTVTFVKYTHDFESRGAHLIAIPLGLITSALDTIVGLGLLVAATASFRSSPLALRAFNYLQYSNTLFLLPYFHLLKAINPDAKFTTRLDNSVFGKGSPWDLLDHQFYSKNKDTRNFYIVMDLTETLMHRSESYKKSQLFLEKHVFSRLTETILWMASLIEQAVICIIATLSMTISILAFGFDSNWNTVAYKFLHSIVYNPSSSIALIMNPHIFSDPVSRNASFHSTLIGINKKE